MTCYLAASLSKTLLPSLQLNASISLAATFKATGN